MLSMPFLVGLAIGFGLACWVFVAAVAWDRRRRLRRRDRNPYVRHMRRETPR